MYKLRIDTHGNILDQYNSGSADPVHNSVDNEGFTWIESDEAHNVVMEYWKGTSWATKTTRPSPWHVWDGTDWVENLGLKATAQGVQYRALRAHRDNLLLNCDWTQLVDAPLTVEKIAEWVTYRQVLRDFPANNLEFLDFSVLVWPEVPL